MAVLDPATILALAVQCSPVKVDPNLILAIARVESGYDPTRISAPNANGTRDYGLMQVNTANFGWLGLTAETALDPCQSIRAGVRVLTSLSAYNTGKPTAGLDNGYVHKVVASYRTEIPSLSQPKTTQAVPSDYKMRPANILADAKAQRSVLMNGWGSGE